MLKISSTSFRKLIISLLFSVCAISVCAGLSACKSSEDYAKDLIKAQNKTETLRDFSIKMTGSIKTYYGFASATVNIDRQYIAYGSGGDRRIYTDSIDDEHNLYGVYYYVGNNRYTFNDEYCSEYKRVKDSEINTKPFEAEKISDFEGANVSRSSSGGNYVYSAKLKKKTLLFQLKELENELPSGSNFNLEDEYECTYTVNKKTGYVVEYDVPKCTVSYKENGEVNTFYISLNFSIDTDKSKLTIEYPETFEEFEGYFTVKERFKGIEKFENVQPVKNEWADTSNCEKHYIIDNSFYAWACDSKTGAVAVGYYPNYVLPESCVDVYDKDMKKISTFHFYDTVNWLSMENGRLAVTIQRGRLSSDRGKAVIYVFDLTDNSLIYETASPGKGVGWGAILYGDAVAYCAEYTDKNLYVYNFSTKQTTVAKLDGQAIDVDIYRMAKTLDGKLSVITENSDGDSIICEVDDNGILSDKYRPLKFSGSYNGMYWYVDNYYANVNEELTSLGLDDIPGANVPDNPEVIYYDGEYALVKGSGDTVVVCDLEKREYIFTGTELEYNKVFFKVGEYVWYCVSYSGICKLDISSLVAGN